MIMRISCIKKDLKEALFITQKVAGKNLNLKELEFTLFDVKSDHINIIATNIEIFVSVKIAAQSDLEDKFLIPQDVLYRILDDSNIDEKIEINFDGQIMQIKDKNSNSTIKTLKSDEFPMINEPEEFKNNEKHINKDSLLLGLKNVQMFASQSLVKPELSAVYIYNNEEDLVFVATDMFRLAEKRILSSLDSDNFNPTLLPIKNTQTIVKILENIQESDFQYLSKDNQFSLKSKNIFLSSRIIDGSFPDYKAIIPDEFNIKTIILKSDFQEAIKKSSIFSDDFGKLTIKTNKKDQVLNLKASNVNIGESSEDIKAKIDSNSDDIEISFNHRYLSEGLNYINSDSIEFSLNDSNSPALIKGVSDDSFLYIVMPMNN